MKVTKLHKKAEFYLEQGREIEAHSSLSSMSKACLLYKLAGKAEGYGIAMLGIAMLGETTDYEPLVGPDCFTASAILVRMAEKQLGYEKP